MDKFRFVIFLSIIFLLTGCAQPKVVEELGFTHSIAYDLNTDPNAEQEGILNITVEMPQIAPTAKQDQEVISVVADTSKEGRAKISRRSDRLIASGQLRTALFGKDIAKKGIADTMDTLSRDHEIGLNLLIITVDGSAQELLKGKYPKHPRTSRFLYDLIEKESKMQLTVATTLHEFLRDYFDDGIDPITPIIKKATEDIEVTGIALYHNDRYVDKITPKDARVFLMLHGDYIGGDITMEIDLEEDPKKSYTFITFNTIQSKRKITVNNDKTPRVVTIDLHVDGFIDEYTGALDLTNDRIQLKIEKKLEEYIETVAKKVIKQLQEKQVDNIGIGQFVRNSLTYQEWKKLDWRKEFANTEVVVNVDVTLKNFGMVK